MNPRIDESMPVELYGCITGNLTNMPDHPICDVAMKAAKDFNNPAFLRITQPVDVTYFKVQASDFLNWLSGARLTEDFLENLQGLAQTANGEPLLTSWVSWERFRTEIEKADGLVASAIRTEILNWPKVDEVYFDFFELR